MSPFMGEKLRGEADYRFIAVEPASCPSLQEVVMLTISAILEMYAQWQRCTRLAVAISLHLITQADCATTV